MTYMKTLKDINTDLPEGKMLMAAIAKLTVESQTDKTPDEVVAQCDELANYMYNTVNE